MSNTSLGIQLFWALGIAALIVFAIHQGRKRKRKQDAEKLGGRRLNVKFKAKRITAMNRNDGCEIEFLKPKHSQTQHFDFNTPEFQLYYVLSGNVIHLVEKEPNIEEARKMIKATDEQIIGIGRLYVNATQMIIMTTPLHISDDDHVFFVDWDLQVDS